MLRGLVAAVLWGPAIAFAGLFTDIYVIGDSLSDIGNVEKTYADIVAARGGTPVPGFGAQIPGVPYYQGRASNGPLWIDSLARDPGTGMIASALGGTNYAYGGARTEYQLYGPPFQGLLQQKDALLADHPVLDPDALYVVWGGANNLQDILARQKSIGGPPRTLSETINDLQAIIDALAFGGARHFLVPNAPNIALVPRIREIDAVRPGTAAAATSLTLAFNAGLAAMLGGEAARGLDIRSFDAYSLFNEVVADAAKYGFANVTDRCYTGDDLRFTGGGTICADPDTYLFWDGIHPTRVAHALIAVAAWAAIPEPGTLLLLGLGLVVVGARRLHARPELLARCQDRRQRPQTFWRKASTTEVRATRKAGNSAARNVAVTPTANAASRTPGTTRT